MAQRKKAIKRDTKVPEKRPECLNVVTNGISTGKDFATFMSLLMGDLVTGSISPMVANAACNAGGKLLKVVEMSYKYGKRDGSNVLQLTEKGE